MLPTIVVSMASPMQISNLWSDDSAVSPVIGVILMVAITVILAAVIASFVLGLGDTTSSAPTASFSQDYDSSGPDVTVTMDSGDPIEAQDIVFRGDALDPSTDGETWATLSSLDDASNIQAGMSTNALNVNDGSYVLRLVYETEDTTSTLQTFEGPDA